MTASALYVTQTPVLPLIGGEDFDIALTFYEVTRVSTDGIVYTNRRDDPYDFTDWTEFYASLTTQQSPGVVKTLSLTLDGLPTGGRLRLRGTANQTWDLQQLGLFSGGCTLLGKNPAGQRRVIRDTRWNLERGSTAPTVASEPDWTALT